MLLPAAAAVAPPGLLLLAAALLASMELVRGTAAALSRAFRFR